MKRFLLICFVTASSAVLAAGSLSAQTAAPAATAAPTTDAAKPAEKKPRQPSAKALEKYDTNKNGVIDPEEKEAMKKDRAMRREEKLKKYDKNGDGKLDDTEKAAMKSEKKAEKAQ